MVDVPRQTDVPKEAERRKVAAEELVGWIKSGNPITDKFENVAIEGDVCLENLQYPHKLVLNRNVFRGKFAISEATFLGSVDLSECLFEQGLTCSRSVIHGQLCLTNVHIDPGAEEEKMAASFEHTSIQGDLIAKNFCASCSTSFRGGKVGGDVNLNGIKVKGNASFDNMIVDGSIHCGGQDGKHPSIEGEFSFAASQIRGGANYHGVEVANVLRFSNAEVESIYIGEDSDSYTASRVNDCYLDYVKVRQEVCFSAAHVDGLLIVTHADIKDFEITGVTTGNRNRMRRCKIKDLILENSKFSNSVLISGAKITGDLTIYSVVIEKSLYLTNMMQYWLWVKGAVEVSDTEVRGELHVQGVRTLKGCRISHCKARELRFDNAEKTLAARIQGVLNIDNCQFDKTVFLARTDDLSEIDWTKTDFGKLEIGVELKTSVIVTGMDFAQISVPSDDYLKFLEVCRPFQRSLYTKLERLLYDCGEDQEARRVYLAMRRRGRLGMGWSLFSLWDWFMDWSVGYGLKSHRLIVYFVSMICAVWALLSLPGALEPTENRELNSRPTIEGSFWQAVQVNLPMVPIQGAKGWCPSSHQVSIFGIDLTITYSSVTTFISLLSYLLLPLLVAAMAGLLRKERK